MRPSRDSPYHSSLPGVNSNRIAHYTTISAKTIHVAVASLCGGESALRGAKPVTSLIPAPATALLTFALFGQGAAVHRCMVLPANSAHAPSEHLAVATASPPLLSAVGRDTS